MTIYTIGYEGCDIEEFVSFLAKKGIKQIADIRKNPVSRKRGFSKNKLAAQLIQKKIAYVHLAQLGVPSAWRKQAKLGFMTREKMFADYVKRILPHCESELKELIKFSKRAPLALLCFEADATDCHRHFVVLSLQRFSERKIRTVNLTPPREGLLYKHEIQKKARRAPLV